MRGWGKRGKGALDVKNISERVGDGIHEENEIKHHLQSDFHRESG